MRGLLRKVVEDRDKVAEQRDRNHQNFLALAEVTNHLAAQLGIPGDELKAMYAAKKAAKDKEAGK